MSYYTTCDICKAHLDPGEHCDCQKENDKEEKKEQYCDDKTNNTVSE